MESNAGMIVRVLKRLKAGVGYHELGMTQHALRCLDSLASLGDIGPFGLIGEVLRDEFVKGSENKVSTAEALQVVARLVPPAKDAISMTLDACYGQINDAARAANSRAGARGVNSEGKPKPAC